MVGFLFWLIWFAGLICVSVFIAAIISAFASIFLEPIKNAFAPILEWLSEYPFKPIVDFMERRRF